MELSFPQKHPKLWFDDGSIIVQADDTLFRVHRSILCAQSEVLNDILSIPHSGSAAVDEVMEGVPLVKMAGDKAKDWAETLMAMYNSCYFGQINLTNLAEDHDVLETLIFPIIGILHIGTKYRLTKMRNSAIAALQYVMPFKLEDMYRPLSSWYVPALLVAEAAIQNKAPTLLPATCYIICKSLDQSGSNDHLLFETEGITWELKAKILSGRAQILFAQDHDSKTSLVFQDLNQSLLASNSIGRCRYSKGGTCSLEEFHRSVSMSWDGEPAPKLELFAFDKFEYGPKAAKCHQCITRLEELYLSRQKEIWNTLPKYFRLGESWEDLNQQQEEY